MSAGVKPEGFDNYVLDVRDASTHVLHTLVDYDQKVMLPALMMALVSIVRFQVEEHHFSSMAHGMSIVEEGLRSLSSDAAREMDGLDNGH
jgi:hypothetical protein